MHINMVRTFLEAATVQSFVMAAKRLHITQSTVSMRIAALEGELGRVLFNRSKAGVSLTRAGEQFQRYAESMARIWQQARHDVGLPPGYQSVLSLGGPASLWDSFLIEWLGWMRANAPEVALRAERGMSQSLMEHLASSALDIGVMYTPQARTNLVVERLIDVTLVMVTTELPTRISSERYVYVEWGPEFHAHHSINHPELSTPRLHIDLGFVGLQYILRNGGSGYFPKHLVKPFLQKKQLKLVPGVSPFTLPAYVVYQREGNRELLDVAVKGLRAVSAKLDTHVGRPPKRRRFPGSSPGRGAIPFNRS
jgi:LysR family transcriptional regulator, flagellar master operon regulator